MRYKGSFLGFLWSLVNPLLMMIVYYLVFVVLLRPGVQPGCAEVPPVGANANQVRESLQCKTYNHYAPFILIGILAWNFTGGSVITGMQSLLNNASSAKKVYFPREVLPISAVMAQFINYLLALVPLFVLLAINGIVPSGSIWLLPIIFVAHILFMVGLALFFSVVVLYFRDLVIIMEVLLQAWFFLTPIIYSMDQVYKEDMRQIVYWLNPMASFIEIYRAILFFGYPLEAGFTLRTCLTGLITFLIGYAFFIWRRKHIGEML